VQDGASLSSARGPAAPRPVLATPPHLIAVPNFSGGGAAVSRECVICEDRSLARRVIDADALLPRAAFVDPELTMGHTPNLTLAAGMDVLSRNIEAYLSTLYHPMCESIALEGAALANRALQALALPPDNPEARADLMMASLLGAIAQQKGLGATRSCARALGAVCGLHDGLANALMLEPVMNFNAEALPERIERIALAMRANCAEDFVPYLRRLKRQIGVTGRLSLYGVRPDQIAELAAQAKADPAHRTNPRPCDLEDFVAFFEAAM
jgi:alcohol dehydrogenase class IV